PEPPQPTKHACAVVFSSTPPFFVHHSIRWRIEVLSTASRYEARAPIACATSVKTPQARRSRAGDDGRSWSTSRSESQRPFFAEEVLGADEVVPTGSRFRRGRFD